jgi:diaminopimelate decarboxylase
MQSSYRVATGQAPPDMAWALGEAWRRSYKALVDCVSHGGLGASGWPAFARIAREMERIASGPPAVNMGYMLALHDSGFLDLGHVSHVSHAAHPSPSDWPRTVEIRIDATIPPPFEADGRGPIDGLLTAGCLERGPGGGLVVDRAGQALVAGRIVPGLSVLGRPTEGCVLGNDTLNRTLHRHPIDWARRMIDRAGAEGVADDAALLART